MIFSELKSGKGNYLGNLIVLEKDDSILEAFDLKHDKKEFVEYSVNSGIYGLDTNGNGQNNLVNMLAALAYYPNKIRSLDVSKETNLQEPTIELLISILRKNTLVSLKVNSTTIHHENKGFSPFIQALDENKIITNFVCDDIEKLDDFAKKSIEKVILRNKEFLQNCIHKYENGEAYDKYGSSEIISAHSSTLDLEVFSYAGEEYSAPICQTTFFK